MSKHTSEFKFQVVQHYLSKADGVRRTAARFGIDQATVRKWASSYEAHGCDGLVKQQRTYSTEFKMLVLQRIASEHLSMRQACSEFNIRSVSTIQGWQLRYNEGGIHALTSKPRGRPKSMSKPLQPSKPADNSLAELTPEAMRKELQYLRAENAYLKKAQALIQAKKSAPRTKR
jgi:transposase-like protein